MLIVSRTLTDVHSDYIVTQAKFARLSDYACGNHESNDTLPALQVSLRTAINAYDRANDCYAREARRIEFISLREVADGFT